MYRVQESAYPQYVCCGSAISGKLTHLNLILLNDCNQNYLGHKLVMHGVDVPWDLFSCSCGACGSSSDSINQRSDHTLLHTLH